ncbi:arginine/serine-rich coiled-coil protein 2 [Cherax quadricarinatus]|uniref:arginine/serine-rich coiled-coil protein 2 n=1 Tax=Cherax quadricarinatus TaxID=27406 RepID=UPI00387E26D2
MMDGSEDSDRGRKQGRSPRRRDLSPSRRCLDEARGRTSSSVKQDRGQHTLPSQSPRSIRRGRANSPGRQSPKQHRRSGRDNSPRRQNTSHESRDHRSNSRDHSPRRQNASCESREHRSNSRDHSPRRQNVSRESREHRSNSRDQSPVRLTTSHQGGNSTQQSPEKHQPGRRPRRGSHRRGRQHKQWEYRHPETAALEGETTTARLEVFSIILHVVALAAALSVMVPMAIVTSRWEVERKMCPLFVNKPPGFDHRWGWGNPDKTPCNMTAFLPIIEVVLSTTLLLFHSGLLNIWRLKGEPPAFAFTRIYTLVVLAIVALETLLAFAVAIILTEGFRHTCISFDLNLSWNEYVATCKENFDDRDEAYVMNQLHTFIKIVMALVGSWINVITTVLLTIVYVTRSKICSCELVCI